MRENALSLQHAMEKLMQMWVYPNIGLNSCVPVQNLIIMNELSFWKNITQIHHENITHFMKLTMATQNHHENI